MKPAIELFSSPKQPKPAKSPPTRDAAAENLAREQADKKRALISRGASTIFTAGAGLQTSESAGSKSLSGY